MSTTHMSETTKQKIRSKLKGHVVSDETKLKMREAQITRYTMKALRERLQMIRDEYHQTAAKSARASRRKAADASTGRKMSDDAKRRMSEAARGRTKSLETKLKMSVAQGGYPIVVGNTVYLTNTEAALGEGVCLATVAKRLKRGEYRFATIEEITRLDSVDDSMALHYAENAPKMGFNVNFERD